MKLFTAFLVAAVSAKHCARSFNGHPALAGTFERAQQDYNDHVESQEAEAEEEVWSFYPAVLSSIFF